MLVSVIVPVFNREGLASIALNSVYNQSHRPIELIVVDDGSTDGSLSEINEWASQIRQDDAFVTKVFSQSNKGAPSARNRGVAESKGDAIQFLDSDDLLHYSKISTQVAVLTKDDSLDYVFCGYEKFSGEAPVLSSEPRATGALQIDLPSYINGFQACLPTGIFRRSFYAKVGAWNEQLRAAQDWELLCRALALEPNIAYVPEVLAFYRQHEQGQISATYGTPAGCQAQLEALQSVAALKGSYQDKARLCQALKKRAVNLGFDSMRAGASRRTIGSCFCIAKECVTRVDEKMLVSFVSLVATRFPRVASGAWDFRNRLRRLRAAKLARA